ncbi:unnamed protein product, partial [Amoebophrya sp. A25]|eukprot:GSA25T00015850001.1
MKAPLHVSTPLITRVLIAFFNRHDVKRCSTSHAQAAVEESSKAQQADELKAKAPMKNPDASKKLGDADRKPAAGDEESTGPSDNDSGTSSGEEAAASDKDDIGEAENADADSNHHEKSSGATSATGCASKSASSASASTFTTTTRSKTEKKKKAAAKSANNKKKKQSVPTCFFNMEKMRSQLPHHYPVLEVERRQRFTVTEMDMDLGGPASPRTGNQVERCYFLVVWTLSGAIPGFSGIELIRSSEAAGANSSSFTLDLADAFQTIDAAALDFSHASHP